MLVAIVQMVAAGDAAVVEAAVHNNSPCSLVLGESTPGWRQGEALGQKGLPWVLPAHSPTLEVAIALLQFECCNSSLGRNLGRNEPSKRGAEIALTSRSMGRNASPRAESACYFPNTEYRRF